MSRRPRNPRAEERANERLTALGRAHLEAVGFSDRTIAKAYRALEEALEAMRVKDFQFHGEVISGPDRVDHEVRVRAAELVTKLADHHPAKLDVEVTGQLRHTSDEELDAILAMLGKDPRALGPALAEEPPTTVRPSTPRQL